jgi:hypothetical protein
MSQYINNNEPSTNIDENSYGQKAYDVLSGVVQEVKPILSSVYKAGKEELINQIPNLIDAASVAAPAYLGPLGAALTPIGLATADTLRENRKKELEERMKVNPSFEKLIEPLPVNSVKKNKPIQANDYPNIDEASRLNNIPLKTENKILKTIDSSLPDNVNVKQKKLKKLTKAYKPGTKGSNDEITKILNQIQKLEASKYENVIN